MSDQERTTRRNWLASILMGAGLLSSYAVFAFQGLSFLLPKGTKPKTRRLFAGRVDLYPLDGVKAVYDLQGTQILVKRSSEGFRAFSSVCPHLGCRVHWEPEESRFFCPCHRGVFDADGLAVSGPPADGNQVLGDVPVYVDEKSGVVYIEVKDTGEDGR